MNTNIFDREHEKQSERGQAGGCGCTEEKEAEFSFEAAEGGDQGRHI